MAEKRKVKLEFKRTGFWWVDLGIVTLYDSFKGKKDLGVALTSSSLVVEGNREILQRAIRDVRSSLKDAVWGETKKGKMWWKGPGFFFLKQYGGGPDTLPIAHDGFKKGRGVKSDICDFCGSQGLVRSVGTSENPFMVTIDRMITFYPSGRGGVNMCWNCTFASVYAYKGIFFRQHENFIDVFGLESTDLKDLRGTLRRLSRLRTEEERFANYHLPKEYYNAQYPLENFLGFIIRMWGEFKERELADVMRGKRFHAFQAKHVGRAGRAISINRYYVIPDVSRFLFLLDMVGENLLPMAGNFYIRRNGETDTLYREELSRRMLWGAYIHDIVEKFLYTTLDRGLNRYFYISCKRVVSEYEKGVIKIEPKLLEDCKSLGETLGGLVADKDDKDVLYALRSVRNLDDLLITLHRIFTRYADEIKVYAKDLEEILQKIDDKNWKRYKSLIGIWAVLNYQMKKGKEEGE